MSATAWTPVDESVAKWKPVEESAPKIPPKTKPSGSWMGEPGTQMEDQQRDTLTREVGSVGSTLAAPYHAFADEPTPEEIQRLGKDQVSGPKRIGLGLERMVGSVGDSLRTAGKFYKDAVLGKVSHTPEELYSVLPEAIGAGAGTVLGGKALEMAPEIPGAIADAAPTVSRLGRAGMEAGKAGAKASIPEFVSKPVRAALGAGRESLKASSPPIDPADYFPARPMDAMSAKVPAETDALSDAAAPHNGIRQYRDPTLPMPMTMPRAPLSLPNAIPAQEAPAIPDSFQALRHAQPTKATLGRPTAEPEFVNDAEVAEHATQGGMQLPTADEARSATAGKTLNELERWYTDRALYDPLSAQEGPTAEQMQATQDFFHSPLKNWQGEVIGRAPRLGEAPIGESPQAQVPSELGAAHVPAPDENLIPALEESVRRARAKRAQPKAGK